MGRAYVTSHFSELEGGQRALRWALRPKAKLLFLVIQAGLIGTSLLLPANLILLVTEISHRHPSQLQETCEKEQEDRMWQTHGGVLGYSTTPTAQQTSPRTCNKLCCRQRLCKESKLPNKTKQNSLTYIKHPA